jgi:uncharacterized membrane-anchored protein
MLVLFFANMHIHQYENILASGKRVVLELAPVDPRSLMQGDYMALRFDVAGGLDEMLRASPPHLASELETQGGGYLLLASDAAGVYRLQGVVADASAATGPSSGAENLSSAGQVALAFRWRRGQAHIVTDAWYFPEGQALRYEHARYGDLRVASDGTGLLLGLLDEQRRPLP